MNGYPDIRALILDPNTSGPVLGYYHLVPDSTTPKLVPTPCGLRKYLTEAGAATAVRPSAAAWASQTTAALRLLETSKKFEGAPRVFLPTDLAIAAAGVYVVRIGSSAHHHTPRYFGTVTRNWLEVNLMRHVATKNSLSDMVAGCLDDYQALVNTMVQHLDLVSST